MKLENIDLIGETLVGKELVSITELIGFIRQKLQLELLKSGVDSLKQAFDAGQLIYFMNRVLERKWWI
jgi:hypothetical protein